MMSCCSLLLKLYISYTMYVMTWSHYRLTSNIRIWLWIRHNNCVHISFIGCIISAVIKLNIYSNSLMHIRILIIDTFVSNFMYLCKIVVHSNIKNVVCFFTYSLNNYILISIDFDFCKLSSSDDVVSLERWWHMLFAYLNCICEFM